MIEIRRAHERDGNHFYLVAPQGESTFRLKDRIKAAGARWNPERGWWLNEQAARQLERANPILFRNTILVQTVCGSCGGQEKDHRTVEQAEIGREYRGFCGMCDSGNATKTITQILEHPLNVPD